MPSIRRTQKTMRAPWLLALCMLVAACATPQQHISKAPEPIDAAAAGKADADRAIEPEDSDIPPAARRKPLANELLGMTSLRVAALLGRPMLIRSEPPAQVWLYRNESCIFHVYLYASADLYGYSVRHIDAVSPRGDAIAVGACFSETIDRARRRPRSS